MKYQTTEYDIQRRIVIDLRIYMYLLQYMIYTDVIDLRICTYLLQYMIYKNVVDLRIYMYMYLLQYVIYTDALDLCIFGGVVFHYVAIHIVIHCILMVLIGMH